MILQTRASTLAVLFFVDSIVDKTRVSAKCNKTTKRNIIADFVPQNTPDIPDSHTVSNDRTRIKTYNTELN